MQNTDVSPRPLQRWGKFVCSSFTDDSKVKKGSYSERHPLVKPACLHRQSKLSTKQKLAKFCQIFIPSNSKSKTLTLIKAHQERYLEMKTRSAHTDARWASSSKVCEFWFWLQYDVDDLRRNYDYELLAQTLGESGKVGQSWSENGRRQKYFNLGNCIFP